MVDLPLPESWLRRDLGRVGCCCAVVKLVGGMPMDWKSAARGEKEGDARSIKDSRSGLMEDLPGKK